MGTIIPIKKWNLETSTWIEPKTNKDKLTSFSIVSYGDIKHKQDSSINYIIIADGCRVENHTKNAHYISNRKAGIANVIKYFEEKKENYRIELILVDKDAPLNEESKRIAHYIDVLSSLENVKTVNFLGFSKCGLIALNMMKYFQRQESFQKSRIYSISAPYQGTIPASPLYVEEHFERIIKNFLGANQLSAKILELAIKRYYSYLSNSHMDLDIAKTGGVPDFLQAKYDPNFRKNIFTEENIQTARKVAHYENIFTQIDLYTIINTIKSLSLGDLGLCLLNDLIFGSASDGLVSLASQTAIEKHFDGLESRLVPSTHHPLETLLYASQILDAVEENIEEKIIKCDF